MATNRSRLGAILGRRCPRCLSGRLFRGPFSMNESCAECGLLFGRGQPGYFTGAMYISYAMAIPLILVSTGLGHLVLPGWSLWQLVLLAWLACIPLIPWIWQYSRVLWVHFDRAIDPEDVDDEPGRGSEN